MQLLKSLFAVSSKTNGTARKSMSLFSRPAPEPLPLRSKHGVQAAGAAAPAADEGWTIKAADGAHLAAPGCLAPDPQPEAAARRLCPPAAQLDTPAYRDSNELWFTVDLEVTADEARWLVQPPALTSSTAADDCPSSAQKQAAAALQRLAGPPRALLRQASARVRAGARRLHQLATARTAPGHGAWNIGRAVDAQLAAAAGSPALADADLAEASWLKAKEWFTVDLELSAEDEACSLGQAPPALPISTAAANISSFSTAPRQQSASSPRPLLRRASAGVRSSARRLRATLSAPACFSSALTALSTAPCTSEGWVRMPLDSA